MKEKGKGMVEEILLIERSWPSRVKCLPGNMQRHSMILTWIDHFVVSKPASLLYKYCSNTDQRQRTEF